MYTLAVGGDVATAKVREASEAIARLRGMGLRPVLLTGDNQGSATSAR